MVNNKTAVPILDPNKPVSVIGIHKKASSVNILDDSSTNGDTDSPKSRPPHPTSTNAPVIQEQIASEPWTGIDLGGIRLKTLAPSLFAFSHITTLYINHNQLTQLSPAIRNLSHLTHLDATGNLLTSIPPELGMITSLKELFLFDNQLTDLPLELGSLHQLEFLGIEGNPISENIRHAMAEKGTSGLITYFRDNCPPPAPPAPRKWEIVEDDPDVVDGQTEHGAENFSLMSYNILADRYAPQTMYGYTPSWALDWTYRRDAIIAEITDPALDIICLQEVEDEVFHEFLLPRLSELGYEGAFSQKTRARTMSKDERRHVDGCATFWKSSK
jgi:CCR4-NOT transcription complex subunit 6